MSYTLIMTLVVIVPFSLFLIYNIIAAYYWDLELQFIPIASLLVFLLFGSMFIYLVWNSETFFDTTISQYENRELENSNDNDTDHLKEDTTVETKEDKSESLTINGVTYVLTSQNESENDELIIIDGKTYVPLDSNSKTKTIEIDGITYELTEKEMD